VTAGHWSEIPSVRKKVLESSQHKIHFGVFLFLFLLFGFTLFMPIRLVEIAAGELKACKVA